jgi:hypothetical protein
MLALFDGRKTPKEQDGSSAPDSDALIEADSAVQHQT